MAQNSRSTGLPDPLTMVAFDFSPNTNNLYDLNQNIPNLAAGLVNLATTFKAAERVHNQLKSQYDSSLRQLEQVGQDKKEFANKYAQASFLNQGLTIAMIGSAVSLGDLELRNEQAKYDEAFNDPWSKKVFDLDENSIAKVKSEYQEALDEKDFFAMISSARILLNQKGPEQRNFAKNELEKQFNDGVIRTTAMGAEQKSPVDDIEFKTNAQSKYGQALRHVANNSQVLWLDSGALRFSSDSEAQSFAMGNIALRAADESFAAGNETQGLSLLNAAEILINLSAGLSRGLLKGLTDTMKAVPALATGIVGFSQTAINDPAAAAVAGANFVRNIPGLAEAIAMEYIVKAEKIQNGNASEKGEALGEIAFEVALAWMTKGSVLAIKKSAQVGIAASVATKATKATRALFTQVAKRADSIAVGFKGPRVNALINIANKNPRAALEVLGAMDRLYVGGHNSAANFLGKTVSAQSSYISTAGGAKAVEKMYLHLESKMATVPTTTFEGTITRGIERTVHLSDGAVINNTIEDVFKVHGGMKSANGRFSIGGPEGQNAIYAAVGQENDVRKIINLELKLLSQKPVIFDSKTVRLSKGLDLSNPKTLEYLGLTNNQINSGSYFSTQVIGDVASTKGFEFILAPSVYDSRIKNIIILK